WLNMDRRDNLMVIESLLLLEEPLDVERFVRILRRRVVDRYPVFRQRPVAARLPGTLPRWEDDPDFTLEGHLHHVVLPDPGDDRTLQEYVGEHLDRPLDRSQALWEMHLVDGYGGGSAIYSRLHHSLADGIALMQVLLSLTDADPDRDLEEQDEEAPPHHGLIADAAHLAGAAVHELPTLLAPTRMPARAIAAATLARQSARVTAKLLLTRNPDTAVSGAVGCDKRVVWSPAVPLHDVVATAHATGTTVNDVLVAALAGALHHYLDEHHDHAVDVPTMVPVNLRRPGEALPAELGNRFALVLMTLPSGLSTPFARLAETKRRMDAIKTSPEAVLTFGLIRAIGRTGPTLERFIVDFFANEASGVTTNVPGPRETRYLAGSRITGLLGWAPESGRQTLGTSIFTYDGRYASASRSTRCASRAPSTCSRRSWPRWRR
ncbi:MAG: wax ester/triacylglycerol synthase family O-acyltransferase, partial [Nocardioidaceae bacterium]